MQICILAPLNPKGKRKKKEEEIQEHATTLGQLHDRDLLAGIGSLVLPVQHRDSDT